MSQGRAIYRIKPLRLYEQQSIAITHVAV